MLPLPPLLLVFLIAPAGANGEYKEGLSNVGLGGGYRNSGEPPFEREDLNDFQFTDTVSSRYGITNVIF
jgi:hypothetical protein